MFAFTHLKGVIGSPLMLLRSQSGTDVFRLRGSERLIIRLDAILISKRGERIYPMGAFPREEEGRPFC